MGEGLSLGLVAGLVQSMLPEVDPTTIEAAVQEWLDNHPEATTTVADGSITEQKLATAVAAKLAEVPVLKSAIKYGLQSITDVIEFSHTETTAIGSHTYTFPTAIPEGTDIIVTNLSSAAFTVNLQDSNGNEQGYGSLNSGKTKTITTPFDTVAIRNYTGSTDWSVKITYGGVTEALDDKIDATNANVSRIFKNNKIDVLFTSNTTVNLIDNGFSITNSGKNIIIGIGLVKTYKTFSEIVEEVTGTYASITDNTLSVTLPAEGCLCYNTETDAFVMRTNVNEIPDNCVEVAWRYYTNTGGRIFDYIRPLAYYKSLSITDILDFLPQSSTKYALISNGFSLTNANGIWVCFNSAKTNVSFSTIATQLGSTYATLTETGIDITLPPEGYLYYDTATGSFGMNANVATKQANRILLAWRYYNQLGGYFFERIRSIVNNTDTNARIDTLITDLSKSTFNASYFNGMRDWKTVAQQYAALFVDVEEYESFLFFTDPHTQYDPWSAKWEEYMCEIQKMYRSTPCNFVLCGGDWLGADDTKAEACYRLGVVKATCKSMLDPCYLLVGNHDVNYQSVRLPNYTISNLWYDGKPAYYTFNGMNTKFYCFDTGEEPMNLTDYNNYGLNQALWFAGALQTETASHIAMAMHQYYRNFQEETWSIIAHQMMLIASAYNTRSSVTVGTESFNYSSATGKIEFVMAGHYHNDAVYRYTENGCDIPVVVTLDTGNHTNYGNDASFDLVFVDYDSRKLYCVRSGVGDDREVTLTSD